MAVFGLCGGNIGSPDKYRGKDTAQMKYGDEKQRDGSRGAYGMNVGNETRIMAARILPAARDRSYRTSCNGHLALRPSEQIG